jgi:hypothetical protein
LIYQAPTEPSKPIAVCACTRGCTTTQCACRKIGAGCKLTCSCVTRGYCRSDPCESPFSQLAQLFGEDKKPWRIYVPRYLAECRVRASPCFTRHLNLNPRKARKLDTQTLESKVMQKSEAWRLDPVLTELRRDIDECAEVDSSDREDLRNMVMIYAMGQPEDSKHTESWSTNLICNGVASPNSYVWSFRKDKWVPRHRTVHCSHCDVCYDLAWHCEKCGTCKAGRNLSCDGCGGRSDDGIWNGEDGPKAPDAHKAQRGLSQVSPRERPRDLEVWNDAVSEVSCLS